LPDFTGFAQKLPEFFAFSFNIISVNNYGVKGGRINGKNLRAPAAPQKTGLRQWRGPVCMMQLLRLQQAAGGEDGGNPCAESLDGSP